MRGHQQPCLLRGSQRVQEECPADLAMQAMLGFHSGPKHARACLHLQVSWKEARMGTPSLHCHQPCEPRSALHCLRRASGPGTLPLQEQCG